MTNLFHLFVSSLFTLQLLFCLLAHLPRHVMARMTELSAILKNIQFLGVSPQRKGSCNAELSFLQFHLRACLQKLFQDLFVCWQFSQLSPC
ncbi:hypothetical protein C8R45DRAFT_1046169, partial [Mycena sanguinolenta]